MSAMADHKRWLVFEALATGAVAGLVSETLVLRMNPEVTQDFSSVIIGFPLWASWGMAWVGLPILAGLLLLGRFRPRPDRRPAPALFAVIFLVAAVLAWVNVRLHTTLLETTVRRVLTQDAVCWLAAGLLALAVGGSIRRFKGGRRLRVAFGLVMLALPAARILWVATPSRQPLQVFPQSLGDADRPLLVVGLEGLDVKVLLVDAAAGSCPTLNLVRETGSWGLLVPHRPYLRWALWTSLATGTYPRLHGVKAHRGWDFRAVFPETLRLLPWTPEGSRMILPWWLAHPVSPPSATVAPLWARLEASGMRTAVFGWPGAWEDGSECLVPDSDLASTPLETTLEGPLAAALEAFPQKRSEIWEGIRRDQARVEAARVALASGADDVWIHLEALSLVRRHHEPLRPRHTRERLLLDLTLELLDGQLATLLDAAPDGAQVAIVSPYGLDPPWLFERMRRMLGGGGEWRTSAETCPDGVFMFLGEAVPAGRRATAATLPDIAPTLCYLLGLPVAQYMEGGVLVDAVEPAYLAKHPLRVVD